MNVRAAPIEDVEAFGVRLARLRREARLFQEDLARLVNCSQRAISLWEAGSRVPNAHLLASLATALGVSMDQLWRGER